MLSNQTSRCICKGIRMMYDLLFPSHISVNVMKHEFWFDIIIDLSLTNYTFSKFLEDTYGYDRTKAAYINGILYETSILICPVVGQVNVSIQNKTSASSRNFMISFKILAFSRDILVYALCFSLIYTCSAHKFIFLCMQHHKGICKNILYILYTFHILTSHDLHRFLSFDCIML